MKRGFLSILFLLGAVFGTGLTGCGDDGEFAALTIIPEGPTVVRKDDTLQFSANRSDVTWSVQGGDANGAIDSSGLYSPPGTIPVGSPRVTMMATSSDGQVATGLIDLRTGDTLNFAASPPLNMAPISITQAFISSFIANPLGDHFGVRLGSVQIDAAWPGDNAGNPNIFYSQNLDLLGFSPETHLLPTAAIVAPASVETDNQKNPKIAFLDNSTGTARLRFLGSDNQGQDFQTMADIAPANPANEQLGGNLRVDAQDALHVVFSEFNDPTGPRVIFYSRSEDGGTTWSAPTPISNSPSNTNPQLAVDPSGENIYVCWQSGESSSDIFFSFSSDSGASFSGPEPLTSAGTSHGCRVARGPAGEIYVAYDEAVSAQDGVFLVKSTDGGDTFGSPVPVNSDPTNATDVFVFLSVDPLGRLDLVWNADPDDNGSINALLHARSLNGGAAFLPNVPVATVSGMAEIQAFGLRHDDAGRMYLQYLQTNDVAPATAFDVNFLVGE